MAGFLEKLVGRADNDNLLTPKQMVIYCDYSEDAMSTHSIILRSTIEQRIAIKTNGITRYELIPANTDSTIMIYGDSEVIPDDKNYISRISGNLYFCVDDLKYNKVIYYISTYHKKMNGDISAFSGKPLLQRLNLAGVSDITGDVSVMNTLPALRYISLGGTGIHGAISDLNANSALFQFRLFSTNVTGNIGSFSGLFPNIQELQITNNKTIVGDINGVSTANLAALTGSILLQNNALTGTIDTLLLNTSVTNINAANNTALTGSKATFKSVNSGNSAIQSNHFDFGGTQVTD